MATNVGLVHFTDLVGGSSGDLDAVDVTVLSAGAIALGIYSNEWLAYQLQNSTLPSESVPSDILPDNPDGNKWWKLIPPYTP